MKNLSIIILHYGSPKITKKAVSSIIKYKVEFNNLIIVDNQGNYPKPGLKKATVLRAKKNLGYAAGMNLAIKNILYKSKYILLLNNDVYFRNSKINDLDKYFSKDIGIISPALRFKKKDKSYYDTGGKLDLFKIPRHENRTNLSGVKNHKTQFVSGAFMLIKSEVFRKVGLFDERFFLYFEDVDFCIRAGKKNLQAISVSDFFIDHKIGESIEKESRLALYYQTKSAILFIKKYRSYLSLIEIIPILILRVLRKPENICYAFKAVRETI